MRYADFTKRKTSLDARIRAHVNNTIESERFTLENETCRLYRLAPDVELHFNPGMIPYGSGGVSIRSPQHGSPCNLTSEVLRVAADCVRHIERWIAGEVDDLLPSGPWQVEP